MTEQKKGVFIAIEGCDGAGKSTALKTLSTILTNNRIPHVTTREPGGTSIAENIRNTLFAAKGHSFEKMHVITEALLVAAARHQHVNNKIIPELENGNWVITDRFNDSTWAYQFYAGGCPREAMNDIEDVSIGTFKPHAVIVLDGDPRVLERRMTNRADTNAFDSMDFDFKDTVRTAMWSRSDRMTSTIYYYLDATQPLRVIEAMLIIVLNDLLAMKAVDGLTAIQRERRIVFVKEEDPIWVDMRVVNLAEQSDPLDFGKMLYTPALTHESVKEEQDFAEQEDEFQKVNENLGNQV